MDAAKVKIVPARSAVEEFGGMAGDKAHVFSSVLMSPQTLRPNSFRRAQWRMLGAVMFCYLFYYTGRQTFGFAIPGIQAELGLSKQTLGWVSAGMLWCYAIGQMINGNLGDQVG